jgi:hypothetical protein
MSEIERCLEPHAEQDGIICDLAFHQAGYHYHKGTRTAWLKAPLPSTTKPKPERIIDLINGTKPETRTGPPTGVAATRAAAAAGIARAEASAPEALKEEARGILMDLLRSQPEVTSEDVLLRMADPDGSGSVMGPIMQWAAREGLIERTGRVKESARPKNHREVRIWYSTLHQNSLTV